MQNEAVADHPKRVRPGVIMENALTQFQLAGHLARAVRQNLWGMWPHFVLYGALSAACGAAGFALAPLLEQLPLELLRGLEDRPRIPSDDRNA